MRKINKTCMYFKGTKSTFPIKWTQCHSVLLMLRVEFLSAHVGFPVRPAAVDGKQFLSFRWSVFHGFPKGWSTVYHVRYCWCYEWQHVSVWKLRRNVEVLWWWFVTFTIKSRNPAASRGSRQSYMEEVMFWCFTGSLVIPTTICCFD